jgi:Pullulanase N2 domain
VTFTVADGLATTIAVQTTGSGAQRVPTAITVETFAPDFGPDLTTSMASWLTPRVLSWNLPDERGRWTYRLHWGPAESLALDAETIGGSSLPLMLDSAGLPSALVALYPDLADAEVLRLNRQRAWRATQIASAGQVAIAAYDESGRLVQATGVTLEWGRR